MQDLIELPTVMYDVRAKDGTWCQLPYPGHKKGCPNFIKGCTRCGDWKAVLDPKLGEQANGCGTHWITYKWYAVIEEFDLEKHANKMKLKHPDWSKQQCYCVLYWQSTVMMKLKAKAEKYRQKLATEPDGFNHSWACHLIEMPEKHGVNVFGTMAKVGVILYKNPKLIRKIMLIGINQLTPQPEPIITEETPDCIYPYLRHEGRRCVYGRCACAGQKKDYDRIMPACQYKRPRITDKTTYALEHGFDCIVECPICGKTEYIIYSEGFKKGWPECSKDSNVKPHWGHMPIIWLASENKVASLTNETSK